MKISARVCLITTFILSVSIISSCSSTDSQKPVKIIISDAPATAYIGVTYNGQFIVNKNFSKWSEEGNLPPGLTLDENGYITGVPRKAGQYMFTVTAVTSGYRKSDDGEGKKKFTLNVKKEDAPIDLNFELDPGSKKPASEVNETSPTYIQEELANATINFESDSTRILNIPLKKNGSITIEVSTFNSETSSVKLYAPDGKLLMTSKDEIFQPSYEGLSTLKVSDLSAGLYKANIDFHYVSIKDNSAEVYVTKS